MKKNIITSKLYQVGAMAIVRTDSLSRAIEIGNSLVKGGIPVMEISYTLSSAGNTIEGLKNYFNDKMCIGAGTVLDSETARHAILMGAEFIIAPNYNREVAIICNRYQIPYCPGCTSLSEAVDALSYGATFIKAFPISDFYGPKLAKVFKTPIPYMPILASGGVTLENLEQWIKNGVDVVGLGGLLSNGDCEEIEKNAKRIREIIDCLRG